MRSKTMASQSQRNENQAKNNENQTMYTHTHTRARGADDVETQRDKMWKTNTKYELNEIVYTLNAQRH